MSEQTCKYINICNYIDEDILVLGNNSRNDFCYIPNNGCKQYQKFEITNQLELKLKQKKEIVPSGLIGKGYKGDLK